MDVWVTHARILQYSVAFDAANIRCAILLIAQYL